MRLGKMVVWCGSLRYRILELTTSRVPRRPTGRVLEHAELELEPDWTRLKLGGLVVKSERS